MIALSTGSSYSYGIARVFDIAARAGFEGIEVLVDHRWDTRQAEYMSLLSVEHSLPIVAVHSPFAARVPGWPDDELGRLHRTVSLAQEVGAPLVVAHLPRRFTGLTFNWAPMVFGSSGCYCLSAAASVTAPSSPTAWDQWSSRQE